MNLFFVHTPLQVLTAQNIVGQFKLKNNILVLSYTGERAAHYYKSFEILLIPALWDQTHKIGDLNNGIFNIKGHVHALSDFNKFNKKINSILTTNKISDIYFGDINHLSYVYLAEKNKDKRLHFFEEGVSHYCTIVKNKRFNSSASVSLKKFITDKFIYEPNGVKGFSKYLYPTHNCEFGFNIYKRYSIIKQNEGVYDVHIPFHLYKSEALNTIIENEKKLIGYNPLNYNVLYLSSTTSADFSNPAEDEMDMFKEMLKGANLAKLVVYLKYHPKDNNDKKKLITEYCTQNGIEYKELFMSVSLPIEIIYADLNFSLIAGYDSSSLFYASEMSNALVVSLLPCLILKYRLKKIKNTLIEDIWNDMNNTYMRLFNKPLAQIPA